MADVISSLPEDILRHILSFNTTKFAISTSVLSKRWRHVWCYIPSLSFNADTLKAASINKTLNGYTAPKMKDFQLKATMNRQNIPHIDTWIKFAMSNNVENLSLEFCSPCPIDNKYNFPDFFYINSSVKKLRIKLSFSHTMMKNINCSVAWTSLKKLSLRCCSLSDESMAKILSGCMVLECLTLYLCYGLKVLDLSKSLCLRTLQVINRNFCIPGPKQIVAPHIHYLRLTNSHLPCTSVDVASLTEAKLEICLPIIRQLNAVFIQDMMLKMLEKLQHVEKLTFGGNFLQILSLAELHGVPFPMFKVKFLTLETAIYQYVIPGIERLLQNSPDLEKLTIRARYFNTIREEHLDNYLNFEGFNLNQCWRSKDGVFWNKCRWDVELKHVVSLVELVLKNTQRLDKMVLLLKERCLKFKFEELLPKISHHNNVFIALSTNTSNEKDEW